MTELCELAEKYGTDKCPQINHSYTPFYFEMFQPIRKKVKKVMELGIGRTKPSRNVVGKASLRMWQDFFPNAQIYGVDCNKRLLFGEERIKTFLGDGTKKEDWERILKKTGTDIDIFIDDGSHLPQDQEKTAEILRPILKGIYIIEDIRSPESLNLEGKYRIIKFIDKERYRRDDNNLIVFE